MANSLLQQLNGRLTRHLSHPGISPQELIRKRLIWMWTVVAAFCILNMTILIAVLGMRIPAIYGCTLLVFYAVYIPLLGRIRNFERLNYLFLLLVVGTTFVFILLLGGIIHSFGLFLVGLTCGMASVLSNKARWTVAIFTLFSFMTILAALLEPYLPPPDPNLTPFAERLLYTLNILWISGSTLIFILNYIKERSSFEEAENRHLTELDRAKTNLYTQITHEFRTPLTVILGMADQVEQDPGKWLPKGVEKIRENGKILLNLVDQMLRISRLEAGAMPVHLTQGEMISFLKYLAESVHVLAARKQISVSFSSPLDTFLMDFDEEKTGLIMSNLLSNAIKFTPSGGKVDIAATVEETSQGLQVFCIRVEDTGIGIPAEKIPLLFDRFYRVEDPALPYSSGSGLGLTLTKELVTLLRGDISVISTPGQGSAFVVRLPVTRNAPAQNNAGWPARIGVVLDNMPVPVSPGTPGAAEPKKTDHDRHILLIVEDNPDVVDYLRSLLQTDYQLEVAFHGQEGLDKALNIIPDIILSDIMMPVMDGIEMMRHLKTDFRTSHIPIILLTAKADIASRLEGLEVGADAYLEKPFSKEELFIRLRKLVELRKIMQEKFAVFPPPEKPEDMTMHQEVAFIQRVKGILEDHLQDEHFDIPQLSRALNMSQAQLYRKFNALTNIPVGKYLRTIRLMKARDLLETTSLNVTEVGFEVGFRNLSHFSHLFKKEFGINPSEMVRKKPD